MIKRNLVGKIDYELAFQCLREDLCDEAIIQLIVIDGPVYDIVINKEDLKFWDSDKSLIVMWGGLLE